MKYSNIREEALKNKVWADFFANFDTTDIPWNIDFCVKPKQTDLFSTTAPLLRAEAKTWNYDVTEMFTQLILTIWKARTFDKTLPPAFLWAFDFKKIAFVEYIEIQDIFYENDFNRNVTPSNHDTKEFKKVQTRIDNILKKKTRIFDYNQDEEKLKDFIKNVIWKAGSTAKIRINKNNFLPIYLRRLEIIKPQIDVNREDLKKNNILDSDFFLADLFVDDRWTDTITDDETIKNDLFVLFENGGYRITKENLQKSWVNSLFGDVFIQIKNKKAYEFFRKNYKRPPRKEYQEYIIQRRDLIVPQDIRERKWAFFTPRIWVEKSQEYMANYFGENYQDEYYIRDCAAWTGNLLAWLTNKYNIYASTLDNADVIVMKNMIKDKTINLLENHVFQFDFLNDNFSELPQSLQDIINDEEKRKKLIVYINPPYAEATNVKTVTWTWGNKSWTSIENKTYEKYKSEIWKASNELFAQFLIRIYKEIPSCSIANFSTLKILSWSNFSNFRNIFSAKLEKMFIVPWNTFDNVIWDFPIGFFIWNWAKKEKFLKFETDIYDKIWNYIWTKILLVEDNIPRINKRIKEFDNKTASYIIWYMENPTPDFLNQKFLNISTFEWTRHNNYLYFTKNNLIVWCIYFAVRECIEHNRTNHNDQFYYPLKERENDIEFQNDCLIFSLLHNKNHITSRETWVNHRIPFTENEVNARDKFASHFMTDFLKGREFSPEAKDVFDAWRELWKYYHENAWTCHPERMWRILGDTQDSSANASEWQNGYLVNASLYEIREYFQWRNDKWKMNNKSDDEKYMELIWNLREKLKILWDKIAEKVYEYEFLKR